MGVALTVLGLFRSQSSIKNFPHMQSRALVRRKLLPGVYWPCIGTLSAHRQCVLIRDTVRTPL